MQKFKMVNVEEARNEVANLLGKTLPSAKIVRVDVQETSDSEGEPSLNVWVVFKAQPKKEDMRQANTIVDELRTWLSQQGDDRFPYLSFITESEEKELSKQ